MENIVSYEELLSHWTESVTVEEQHARAQQALAELEAAGYLTGIRTDDPSCEDATLLDAIEACLRADELRPLLKRFCRRTASGLSRREAVQELRRGLRGQRTLGSFFTPSPSSRPGGAAPPVAHRRPLPCASVCVAPCARRRAARFAHSSVPGPRSWRIRLGWSARRSLHDPTMTQP